MENPAFKLEIEDVKQENNEFKKEKKFFHTYEEAVTLAGNGKFHMFLFLTCGLCLCSTIIETVGASIILPVAKCDLNISPGDQGILLSMGFLGIVLSCHMWGFLADTWGRRQVIRLSVTSAFVMSVISAASVSPWMLILFRFLAGFGAAGIQACIFSYLGEFHGAKTRPTALTHLSVFLSLGMVYLPAIGLGILPWETNFYISETYISSWRIFLLVASIPTFISAILMQFLPESPKYLLIQNRENDAIEALRLVFKWNKNLPEHEYPVKTIRLQAIGANLADVKSFKGAVKLVWSQTAPVFYRIRIWGSVKLLTTIFLLFFVAHGLNMWAPTILTTMVKESDSNRTICEVIKGISDVVADTNVSNTGEIVRNCASMTDKQTYQILIFFGICMTVSYFLSVLIVKPFGRKKTLFCLVIGVAACAVGILWANIFYLNVVLLIGILIIGNGGGFISAISVEFYPVNFNGMAVCLVQMFGRLGAVTGSNVVGILLRWNCDATFMICAGVALACAALVCFLPGKPPRTTRASIFDDPDIS